MTRPGPAHTFAPSPPPARRVRPALIIVLLGVLAALAFYKYGRSIWKPIQIKLLGGRSIADVLKRHRKGVQRRFPAWQQLTDGKQLTLLAFKQERTLELWKWQGGRHRYIKTYKFTGFSGALGPKLRQGDGQIPEGIYELLHLNPNSSYHLSMKVSYPNAFDRKMARRDGRKRLGGDIFIHGKSVTIGCIPIGDEPIEELFTIIATNRHRRGARRTRVIIAPYDMRRKTKLLQIQTIAWEQTLYQTIRRALRPYQRTKRKPPQPRPADRPQQK